MNSNPTPPRQWPRHAEAHREDAIACLLDILTLTAQAQELIAHGRNLEAIVLLQRARQRAEAAADHLRRAASGLPNLEKDEIDRCRGMWGNDDGNA